MMYPLLAYRGNKKTKKKRYESGVDYNSDYQTKQIIAIFHDIWLD